jgi:hypothetical protein
MGAVSVRAFRNYFFFRCDAFETPARGRKVPDVLKGDLGGNRLQRREELRLRPDGGRDGWVVVGVSGLVSLGVSLSVHRVASISLPEADV